MIVDQDTKVIYTGDGKTTVFPFEFPINSADHIHVVIYDSETDTETELTKDFFVDSVAGTVTYPGYAPREAPSESERPAILSSSQKIAIYRRTPITQEVGLGSKYPLPILESMPDKLTMIIQEIREEVDRCFKNSISGAKTFIDYMKEIDANAKTAIKYALASQDSAAKADELASDAAESASTAKELAQAAAASAFDAQKQAGLAENAAMTVQEYNAPLWEDGKTYNIGDIVQYTDGSIYRSLADGTTALPTDTDYWTKITTYVGDDFFELDENGDLMPTLQPTYSGFWALDANGDIVPIGAKRIAS